MDNTKIHNGLKQACDIVGNQRKLAKLLEVTPSAVNRWLKLFKPIPAKQCVKIEKLTQRKVICEELNDSIEWTYLRQSRTKVSLRLRELKQEKTND